MTKCLIIIAILVLLYLYWKYQQKTIAPKPDEIIERKGKETFWDAEDFDLDSDDSDNESNNSHHD